MRLHNHMISLSGTEVTEKQAGEKFRAACGREEGRKMKFIQAKGILSPLNGINVYRGCTHGCIYCDGRSECYHTPVPFEDIEVKENAPELLEEALRRKRQPCVVSTGSMCDPYMPCEERLLITRKCLEIIDRYSCGAAVQTKSDLVLRDADLLEQINRKTKAVIQVTITTCDEKLCRLIEPNVCSTEQRYRVLKEFQKRKIPTVVWLTPILPFINDTEENLKSILELCFDAGVQGIVNMGFGVTLRAGDREYFYAKLDEYFPGIKQRYVQTFQNSYECLSENDRKLKTIFEKECADHGVMYKAGEILDGIRKMPEKGRQLSLFDL